MRTAGLAWILAFAVAAAPTCAQQGSQVSALPELSELQNPTEIKEFDAPCEIVSAMEYWDGGTTYVVLRDARKRHIVLCVSQHASESTVPGDTLFLNAPHSDEPTARLPFSESEARLVVESLKAALDASLTKEEVEALNELGDPAEERMREIASVPENERWSTTEWSQAYAFDALRRLQSRSSYDVASADGAIRPSWHPGWAADAAKKRAEDDRNRDVAELFKSLYSKAGVVLVMMVAIVGSVAYLIYARGRRVR
jgi:hypothetical protein